MRSYRNAWFINFNGIGNGIAIAPVLKCFELSYPTTSYFHTYNQILADKWFVGKACLNNLKGFTPITWRRFLKNDWHIINQFIEDHEIDLIVNLRNEGPQYDTGYYQYKAEYNQCYSKISFWDLNFEVIERRSKPQNVIEDIINMLIANGVNILTYNTNWLKTIRKYEEYCCDVGFGMAASQSNKRWPVAKWIELGNQIISKYNNKLVLFPGNTPDEINQAKIVLGHFGEKNCRIASKLTLKEVAHKISELKYFISNDTGLLHIAAAIDVPLLGLYICTDSKVWSPLDKTNTVLFQNSHILQCSCLKPHCGNCYHYYEVCPTIYQHGDDIEPVHVFKQIITLFR